MAQTISETSVDEAEFRRRYKAIYTLNVQPYANTDEAFEEIVKTIAELLNLKYAAITRVADGWEYTLLLYNGERITRRVPKMPLRKTYCDTVCDGGGPLVINNANNIEKFCNHYANRRGICSYIGVPLRLSDGSIYGTLCAFDDKPHNFGQAEVEVLELVARRVIFDIERQLAEDSLRSQNEKLQSALDELAAVNGHMKSGLAMAQQIQRQLLPLVAPDIPGIELVSEYLALEEIGGDFIDYSVDRNGAVGVLIGDASGHGVPAALVACMTKIAMENLRSEMHHPKRLLTALNQVLFDRTGGYFVTVCYAVYDPKKQMLSYSNGGHPAPYLLRQNQPAQMLQARGKPLALKQNPIFEQNQVKLEKGDRVLFITDGILECRNDAGEEFSPAQLAATLSEFSELEIDRLPLAVLDYVARFMNGKSFEDDVAIVALGV